MFPYYETVLSWVPAYHYTSECLVRKGETENKAEKCQADRDKWKKPRRDTSKAFARWSVFCNAK